MKKILVPIDFSPASLNAAHYAASLACRIQAQVALINVFQVPVESPLAGSIVWPLEDYASMEQQSRQNLKKLAAEISNRIRDSYEVLDFKPPITTFTAIGEVIFEISEQFRLEKMNLVVAGVNNGNNFSRCLLGSHIKRMIGQSKFPLLLIPENHIFRKLHKIAFATDISPEDITLICSLAALATPFNAEILIVHTTSPDLDGQADRERAESFLDQVAGQVDYRKIYYRHLNSQQVKAGLEWIAENGQIDMLVMVHRRHSMLENILNGSYSKKMVGIIDLPLLIFPASHQFPL